MSKNLSGFVYRVRKHANGDMEISFMTEEEQEIELHYFINPSKNGELPKEIAYTLAETLDRNIWSEISFDENGIATSITLEEAGSEED